jgi:hypothetical protein
VAALEDSTRVVEECGLQGIIQGATGSLNCYCPVQDPIQEVLEFRLHLWPSSIPKRLGSEVEKDEVSIWDPHDFLIQEEGQFMPPK